VDNKHLVVVDETETSIFFRLGRCRSRRSPMLLQAPALLLGLPGSPNICSLPPRLREEAADDCTGLLEWGSKSLDQTILRKRGRDREMQGRGKREREARDREKREKREREKREKREREEREREKRERRERE
jgi:hypothetical protein